MPPPLDPLSPVNRELLLAIGTLAGVAAIALVIQGVVFTLLHRLAVRPGGPFTIAVARATAPSRFIFPLLGVEIALPLVALPEKGKLATEHLLGLLIIAAIAWVLVALAQLAGDLSKRRLDFDADDNLHARQIETRVDLLTRAAVTIVVFVSTAAALTTFPAIRAIGATLLASAGLIGIMAGFAARPIFANLVAGIQIALTQPIRIGDVLVVEGENGRVEKIESTYVVVRLWDLRRMVLPLTYFIDKPFENWTYSSTNLVGSVVLYIERMIDIDALRAEAKALVATSPLWDNQVVDVAVTDTRENFSVELRVLVSARNAANLFDLRCFMREHLLRYLASTKT